MYIQVDYITLEEFVFFGNIYYENLEKQKQNKHFDGWKFPKNPFSGWKRARRIEVDLFPTTNTLTAIHIIGKQKTTPDDISFHMYA